MLDEEPAKPLLTLMNVGNGVAAHGQKSGAAISLNMMGTEPISFDLAKEYEKQEQRLQEAKILEA